jgi:GNAT superfamily N-acetyltransferase
MSDRRPPIRARIRPLSGGDAAACDAVIASLPYHFGDEGGIAECARAVREQEGIVATIDDDVVGFLTFARPFSESAEITWMAVHEGHRRRGIGRDLMDDALATLRARGAHFVFVLTLGPSVPEDVADGYEGTRRFYRAMGFVPIREFGLRSWRDEAALLLVRQIEPRSP